MPCMCGDTQCPSCGPAQGNWKCPICGNWQDDGCEHFGENGNPTSPEVEKQLHDIAVAENEADKLWGDAYEKELEEMQEWKRQGLI